jgi:hypothetical protein
MKILFIALALLFVGPIQAHNEGHGPKLSDSGKYGGLVSSVILKSDAKMGASAALVHKAELVRSADGTTRVYLYDTKMKPLEIKVFDSKGSASLAVKVKGKWKNTYFVLEQKEKAFVGKMPKPEGRPYNIDITLKQDGKELLAAFDNLD